MNSIAIDFLECLLQLNPQKRHTGPQALSHLFFTDVPPINPNPPVARNNPSQDNVSPFPTWRKHGLKGRDAIEEAFLSLLNK